MSIACNPISLPLFWKYSDAGWEKHVNWLRHLIGILLFGWIPDQKMESMVVPIPKCTNASEPGHYRFIFPPPAKSVTLGEAHRHVSCRSICSPLITCPTIRGFSWKLFGALFTTTQDWICTIRCGREVAAVLFQLSNSVPHLPLIKKSFIIPLFMIFLLLYFEWIYYIFNPDTSGCSLYNHLILNSYFTEQEFMIEDRIFTVNGCPWLLDMHIKPVCHG